MSGPVLCPKCKGLHFRTSPCVVRVTKSTAARKDVLAENAQLDTEQNVSPKGVIEKRPRAGTQALPVDTNSCRDSDRLYPQLSDRTTSAGTVGNEDRQPIPKRNRGRPRTITDMKVYKAMKQREYRERKKSEH